QVQLIFVRCLRYFQNLILLPEYRHFVDSFYKLQFAAAVHIISDYCFIVLVCVYVSFVAGSNNIC
ncbi:MAG: hypothetical protein LBH47_01600, partial [Christensenellaceae bacterium]|nr:hypothetical protein [Christensenellaceae bacterium]